jgi:hypothetical protein
MLDPADPSCPFCWQPVELDFDPVEAGSGEHRFVQDCDVCCHPLAIVAVVDRRGRVTIQIERG